MIGDSSILGLLFPFDEYIPVCYNMGTMLYMRKGRKKKWL